jgi:hypothetical protein
MKNEQGSAGGEEMKQSAPRGEQPVKRPEAGIMALSFLSYSIAALCKSGLEAWLKW